MDPSYVTGVFKNRGTVYRVASSGLYPYSGHTAENATRCSSYCRASFPVAFEQLSRFSAASFPVILYVLGCFKLLPPSPLLPVFPRGLSEVLGLAPALRSPPPVTADPIEGVIYTVNMYSCQPLHCFTQFTNELYVVQRSQSYGKQDCSAVVQSRYWIERCLLYCAVRLRGV